MKLNSIKLNKRRYTRPNFAKDEYMVIHHIGKEWVVATDQAGKEVVFVRDGVEDDEWKLFDDEIIFEDEPPRKGLL